MRIYSTGDLGSSLRKCDNIEELREKILPLMQDQRSAWQEKIEDILAQRGYTCRQLAQLCKVSEPAVRKWRKGAIPQSRDMYIRIGFAAGYDLEEMNSFLQRYGKCPRLYVKSLEDSVCMFVLESDWLEHSYDTYLKTLDLVRKELQGADSAQRQAYTTQHLHTYFKNLKSMEEMVRFAKAHASSYRQAYSRLYGYIIAYLQINLQSEFTAPGEGRSASFHAMEMESQWSSSLRQCISEIRNKKWFPLRHKLISLGLHLNMDTEAINRMLRYAQMEPLYAKNPVEAAVLWAIEEAKLCSEGDVIVPDGSSYLFDFVKNVLHQLDFTEEDSWLIGDLR